jgi:small subunit ribosomal protein S8
MTTDPIADMLTRIRNGLMAEHNSVEIPHSRIREELSRILKEQGYVSGYSVAEGKPSSTIKVILKYEGPNREPIIQSLRRISKPGRRVYVGSGEIPFVLGGLGITVLSTSNGVMTGSEARKAGVGGEILCEVY